MARRSASSANYGSYYVYPVSGGKVGRVDQGVDFTGKLSVLALGRARIKRLGAPGWPGGGGILYQLLEGPYRGRYVFANEAVRPSVRVGQEVRAGEVIGHVNSTYPGLEMGWAKANGEPVSHAEYHEGMETRAGKAFAGLLLTIKAQRGELFGHTPIDKVTGAPQEGAEAVAGAASSAAGDLLSGLFGDIHPEALMLNIGLIGGGAFLAYYGAALMLGVKVKGVKP